MNVIELLQDQVGDTMLGSIGGALGLDPNQARGAMGAAVPSLLAMLAGKAQSADGASSMLSALGGLDDGMLGKVGDMLGGGGGDLISKGQDMVGSIFGGDLVGLLSGVLGKFTGLNGALIAKLLGVAAPLVLGVLKKAIGGSAASAIPALMAGQGQNIAGALPAGLGSMLAGVPAIGGMLKGLPGLGSLAQAPEPVVKPNLAPPAPSRQPEPAHASGGSPLKWLIPLVALAALGYWAFTSFSGKSATTPTAGNNNTAIGTPALPALGTPAEQLSGSLDSTLQAFNGITDVKSAREALPAITASTTTLTGLSSKLDGLSGPVKSALGPLVTKFQDSLKPTLERLEAIPGVSKILEPVLKTLNETLAKFTA